MPQAPAPLTVYYHADCPDGFAAAWCAWRRHRDAARYRPMHHGEAWEPADVAGRRVLILDYSFPPAELVAIAGLAAEVVQIDHHATALAACAARLGIEAPGRTLAYRHPTLPLQLLFDLDKSGARLGWEHFADDAPLPAALAHVEDQDLWRFRLPGTREFVRALRLLPYDFPAWDAVVTACGAGDTPRYRELLGEGRAIEDFFQREVARLADSRLVCRARLRGEPVDALQALRHGRETVGDGERTWLALPGLAVNANALFASELGNRLAELSGSYGLVWQLAGDGEAKVSLRSQGDFDVGAIAARYGGGGHRNAAGFRLPLAAFVDEILVAPTQVNT